MHINDLLKVAVASGASDLHLKVGSYPMMRVNGSLYVASEEARLDRTDTESMATTVFTPDHLEKFRKSQEVDLAYSVPGLGRFRVNVFQQRGTVGLALRVIPTRIKTVEELGLPLVLKRIASEERGLVLVTGTTGSGKSTTLAALIDYINATRAAHIMTVQIWLGGIQGAGAMAPNDKWTWNGDATRPLDSNHYTNWASGRPDDAGGGVENGREQCATIRPGGSMRPRMERPVTLLPEPDSPTRPTTSPAARSKDTPSTAFTVPARVSKCVVRSRTSSSAVIA